MRHPRCRRPQRHRLLQSDHPVRVPLFLQVNLIPPRRQLPLHDCFAPIELALPGPTTATEGAAPDRVSADNHDARPQPPPVQWWLREFQAMYLAGRIPTWPAGGRRSRRPAHPQSANRGGPRTPGADQSPRHDVRTRQARPAAPFQSRPVGRGAIGLQMPRLRLPEGRNQTEDPDPEVRPSPNQRRHAISPRRWPDRMQPPGPTARRRRSESQPLRCRREPRRP